MLCNISKLVVAALFVVLMIGCQPKTSSPSSVSVEELRLLTPEQEKKLYEQAERVERKEMVSQPIKNNKGEVIGTVTSQTTIIFLKPGGGGGKFSVNASCIGSCSGTPTTLCLDKKNQCGCTLTDAGPVSPQACACQGCSDELGCQGNCARSSSGFGNFGVFIAMDRDNPLNTSVAHK